MQSKFFEVLIAEIPKTAWAPEPLFSSQNKLLTPEFQNSAPSEQALFRWLAPPPAASCCVFYHSFFVRPSFETEDKLAGSHFSALRALAPASLSRYTKRTPTPVIAFKQCDGLLDEAVTCCCGCVCYYHSSNVDELSSWEQGRRPGQI